MSLPAQFDKRQVHWAAYGLDGTRPAGRVKFEVKGNTTLSAPGSNARIPPIAMTFPIVNGEMTATIPVTDDPEDISPAYLYHVTVSYDGGYVGEEFDLAVPIGEGTLELFQFAALHAAPAPMSVQVLSVAGLWGHVKATDLVNALGVISGGGGNGGSVDLTDYYTREEIDEMVSILTGGTVDFSNYYSKSETDLALKSADTILDSPTKVMMLLTERNKLSSVAQGATSNSADAFLRNRANHTGQQTTASLSDFNTAVNAIVSAVVGAAPTTLDTLIEIDNAIGNDPNFSTTVMTALATKMTKPTGSTIQVLNGLGVPIDMADLPMSDATSTALEDVQNTLDGKADLTALNGYVSKTAPEAIFIANPATYDTSNVAAAVAARPAGWTGFVAVKVAGS